MVSFFSSSFIFFYQCTYEESTACKKKVRKKPFEANHEYIVHNLQNPPFKSHSICRCLGSYGTKKILENKNKKPEGNLNQLIRKKENVKEKLLLNFLSFPQHFINTFSPLTSSSNTHSSLPYNFLLALHSGLIKEKY